MAARRGRRFLPTATGQSRARAHSLPVFARRVQGPRPAPPSPDRQPLRPPTLNRNSPLDVALCITELDVGGAERCCAELAARLDRIRFAPVVYALSPPPADRQRSVLPRLEQAGVPVVFLGGRGMRDLPRVVVRLRRHWRNRPPAIVQSLLFHANLVARWAASGHPRPVVLSGVRVAERAAKWHLLLDRWTQRRADGYVCVSQQVAGFCRDTARLPAGKLHVIPNGVDVEAIRSQPPAGLSLLGVPNGRRVAVAIGRLERQKGIDRLLPLADVWRRGGLANWDLLLVGDGPDRPELQRQFDQRGAGSRVHFAGWRPDVPAILRACHLLVLPSRWEGMPNAVLEAMAAGLPVAATDVEGVREILGPLAAEQVVPNTDGRAIVELLASLAEDEPQRQRLGRENQARAGREFSWDQRVREYEALWERLLGQRTP